ncbi:reverse transcriptase domain-containing protein [Tanacetum coccineum]
MEIHVRDKVMLKVSPWKGVVHFVKRGKLNPRYVGPFKVLEKVRAIAYKLELPRELSRVHNTFHVSNLKKCYANEPLAVSLDGLRIDDKLHFVKEPVEIMEHKVKRLRQSHVSIVKENNEYKTRDTLVVVILEVICIKDLVALHFGDIFVMDRNLCILNNEQVKFHFVMLNSEDSMVTYMKAPPSPNIVPGPEYPPSPVYVPYVPEPVYPEFMPPEDYVLLTEKQPLPDVVSPTADSPGYITESDPEEDPEDDDEDPKEDPANYPNGRDDDEEEEEESSGDDADDEEEDKDEDEEEEHLALADSIPLPTCRTTARMSIRDQTPIPFPPAVKVDRFLAISTPPPSPLTSYSSPLLHIPSPPLPVSSPLLVSPPPLHASHTYPLGYKAAMIRVIAPSTYILASRSETPPSGTPPLLPIPLPTSSPPLLLPFIDCLRFKVGESSSTPTARPTIGFRADYRFVGTLDDKIRQDPEREVGYGITNTWDEMVEDMQGTPIVTDVARLRRLDDAHDDRSLMSGQLNMLRKDRRAYARTARLMESEARLSREAWVQSMDASDTACSRVRALRTAILAQHTKIRELREIDCRRQTQLTEALTLMRTLQTQKMAPKRTTRSTPATTTTPTTSVTDEQLKRLIDQGVADALEACDADRSRNGKDSHDSGMGVVELTQWFERMETVFHISNCSVENHIKFSTCTLLGSALTWWNSHVKTVGHDVKGTNVVGYNQRFQELALMYARMFPEESDKIEKYVGGLPDMIHGSSENKRKQDDNQQQQNKRQNTGRAYAAGSGEKKPYGGSKPLCSKYNYHNDSQCAPKCHKCNRVGHLARDCRSTANANSANNQRGTRAGQKPTCFECGAQGHFKRECPKLKNNNRGNQGGNGNAPAKVYAVGRAGTNPNSNVVTGTFLLNNRYASILFDTGADRSFVSTTFNSQIDITPS